MSDPAKMTPEDYNETIEFFNREFNMEANLEELRREYNYQEFTYSPQSYKYIFALAITYTQFFEGFIIQMQIENEKHKKYHYVRDVLDIVGCEDILRYPFCEYMQIIYFSNPRYKLSNHKNILVAHTADFIDYLFEKHMAELKKEAL